MTTISTIRSAIAKVEEETGTRPESLRVSANDLRLLNEEIRSACRIECSADGVVIIDGVTILPEHPVIAAIRSAPKLSPEDSAKCRAMMAEAEGPYLPADEFWERVRRKRS